MARSSKAPDSPAPAKEPDKEPKRGRSNLIPAVVLAVGLLGGGFLMSRGGGGAAAAAPADAAATGEGEAPHEPEPGEIVVVDPITLNLADGRFLKVGLALQLPKAEGGDGEAAHGAEGEGEEEAAEGGVDTFTVKALDETIAVLGDLTYAELAAPGGRAAAKERLSHAVAERYEGEVMGVMFTEFVMQ